jgi:hypothetical protein
MENRPALPPRRRALVNVCLEQALNLTGPGNDPHFARMSEAIAEEVVYGELGDVIEEAWAFREGTVQPDRPQMDSYHTMQLTRRNFQHQFLKKFPHDYPANFSTPQQYREAIREVLADPSARMDFDHHQTYEDVRSNVVPRYAIPLLLGQLLLEPKPEGYSVLDVGCSANLGLIAMYGSKDYDFEEIEIVRRSSRRVEVDKEATEAANEMIDKLFPLGASLGVDRMPIEHDNLRWVRSCSFYPSELLQPAMIMKFDDLTQYRPRQVGFYEADFSKPDHLEGLPLAFALLQREASRDRGVAKPTNLLEEIEFRDRVHPDKELFDFVTFITSMYLMSQADRLVAIDRAKRLVKKSGHIFFIDFAETYDRSSTGMRFHNNFTYAPYPYRVHAISGVDLDRKPVHIMSAENGRARRISLEPNEICVRGTMRTVESLLLDR